ncbi:MAG TPA: hypothetical protein PLO28_02030, partial [bacterium]|nr:hypothetical protein [bacterium]
SECQRTRALVIPRLFTQHFFHPFDPHPPRRCRPAGEAINLANISNECKDSRPCNPGGRLCCLQRLLPAAGVTVPLVQQLSRMVDLPRSERANRRVSEP